MSWLLTVQMIRILKNNSGDKMQLAKCGWESFHLHLRRQKSNCLSVAQFMDVLFYVILTRTLLENLLSVVVTHSNDINVRQNTRSSLAFAMNATDNINVVFRKSAYILMSRVTVSPTVLLLPLTTVMHISSLHWWIRGRVCYMKKNKNR